MNQYTKSFKRATISLILGLLISIIVIIFAFNATISEPNLNNWLGLAGVIISIIIYIYMPLSNAKREGDYVLAIVSSAIGSNYQTFWIWERMN